MMIEHPIHQLPWEIFPIGSGAGRRPAAAIFLARTPILYWNPVLILILNLDLAFRSDTTLHTSYVHPIICAPRPKNHIVMAQLLPRAPRLRSQCSHAQGATTCVRKIGRPAARRRSASSVRQVRV
eukprot:COSAG02_NODE_43345_length_375_cov_2.492754_1_plen_124_part_11